MIINLAIDFVWVALFGGAFAGSMFGYGVAMIVRG